ncbi:unnamed protein product [Linum tenue]|uniref:Uncharacterized protein n=1 Tax=Linum tenue TaxID=586396 RepID=A0AAV0KQG5_9ROSI|nr:unnamed protein product [Linum tenue]
MMGVPWRVKSRSKSELLDRGSFMRWSAIENES